MRRAPVAGRARRRTSCFPRVFAAGLTLTFLPSALHASGLPVVAAHPRLLLTPAIKAQLSAKRLAGDASWLALKTEADQLKTFSIFSYEYATRSGEPNNTIFYDYEGSGWFAAAMPLALAYQVSGDASYATNLVALADELLRAQSDPANNPPTGRPPLEVDSYFPTRFVGPVLAVIYDWAYEPLGANRRAQLVALMNADFDDLRAHAYQANDHADGNYFGGHLLAAAAMGYASFGDNPRAQEMIDYARLRFDGTPSALVDPANVPSSFFAQVFDGGYAAAGGNLGAPFLGGFDFQGWAYGTGEYDRLIDYLLMVRSATGEDLVSARLGWFSQILRALEAALVPNHFEIDPSGDWGGNQGAVVIQSLPLRLAYLLAGSADGPGAQYFLTSEIAHSSFSDVSDNPPAAWESFFFGDPGRPAAPLAVPLYYSSFAPRAPAGGATNGAMPSFTMRSSTLRDATWATLHLGCAFYDDHQHKDAGHLTIAHGSDYLLVDAASWMGAAGSEGIVGGSTEADNASSANTLFFDDYGDYMYVGEDQYFGGQGAWGHDQVVADDQNDSYTYARAELSSAYDNASLSETDRRLRFFYRNFMYLRGADIFVIFDQVRVAASTNSRGAYRRHLRWHFSNQPQVSGHLVRVDEGASRLYLDTLLPLPAAFHAVDESNNPDCHDSVTPCVLWPAYINNSGTWRLEVSDPAQSSDEAFLTVLAAGATALPPPSSTLLTSLDGTMTGAVINQAGTGTSVVLFNSQAGQEPAPITGVSYLFAGPVTAVHTLTGVEAGANYAVSWSGGIVHVTASAAGAVRASAAGVLQFTLTTAGLSFYTVFPCRLLDTRGAGGPALLGNAARILPIAGSCGIPADALAVAVNLTVVNPTASGVLVAAPAGVSVATSSLNFKAHDVRANSAIVSLTGDPSGSVGLMASLPGQTDLLIDVTGYFK
jgi:hypothetical protein